MTSGEQRQTPGYPRYPPYQKRMKPMKNLRSNRPGSRSGLSVRGIAMAAALVAFGAAGSVAHAQSTDGKVFGNAPVGSTVLAKSTTTGTRREVRVDKKGRYAIRA